MISRTETAIAKRVAADLDGYRALATREELARRHDPVDG
jgi:hypothetical protein